MRRVERFENPGTVRLKQASIELQQAGPSLSPAWTSISYVPGESSREKLICAPSFLVTGRELGFVVADHPVVACNQFAEHHRVLGKWPTITNSVAKGLQVFMPLSPTVTLCLYDPGTYAFDVDRRVCKVGPRDVRFLNAAQAINAWECVFLDPRRSNEKSRLALLRAREDHPDVHKPNVFVSDTYEKSGGRMGQLVSAGRRDVRIGARYSFLRVTEHAEYLHHDAATIPPRSEALVRFLEDYGEMLDRVEEEAQELPEGEEMSEDAFRALALEVAQRKRVRPQPDDDDEVPDGIVLHPR